MQGTVDFLLLAIVQLRVDGRVSDCLSCMMKTEGGWRVERVEWSLVSWTSHYEITVLLHALFHFRTPVTWTSLTAPKEPERKEYKKRETNLLNIVNYRKKGNHGTAKCEKTPSYMDSRLLVSTLGKLLKHI